ncbi:MAG: chemotaxis-specific protein-glutamate methyltransferase CheB [Oligoflexus sp.]
MTESPSIITTVLGSCVSVCLYSTSGSIAAINHYALPYLTAKKDDDLYRYGNVSLKTMIETVLRAPNITPKHLRAKLVGGASIKGYGVVNGDVGEANVRIAQEILAAYNIEIVGSDTGGKDGRKVLFYTDIGKVRVCRLQQEKHSPIDRKNQNFKPTIAKAPFPEKKKIKVLIVDDSKTIQALLQKIFHQDPDIQVVGVANHAIEAEKILKFQDVDVMTLDIHMPIMDGVTFLENLMKTRPLPVVMVTSLNIESSHEVLRALELGAVDYIQKPKMNELMLTSDIICEKVKSAGSAHIQTKRQKNFQVFNKAKKAAYQSKEPIIAIGASTGGTEAIKNVLTALPEDIPPIVIVQHIPPIFSKAYANRLNDICPFAVKEADDNDRVLAGRVLIAPGGLQMYLEADRDGFFVRLRDDPPVNRHKPSVDALFHSVAKETNGHAIGVLLTGMGNDGAKGLLELKQRACLTIAQDENSSVVFGMPKEAIRMGAVDHILDIEDIPFRIMQLLRNKKRAL